MLSVWLPSNTVTQYNFCVTQEYRIKCSVWGKGWPLASNKIRPIIIKDWTFTPVPVWYPG